MSVWVVDASVAVKWLVSEQLSEKAVTVLERPEARIAPSLLMTEVANVLWKKVRTSQLSASLARERLSALGRFQIELHPTEPLMDAALEIAIGADRTVYDSLYVALAEKHGCPLVTADQRLVNALASIRPDTSVIWLGSL